MESREHFWEIDLSQLIGRLSPYDLGEKLEEAKTIINLFSKDQKENIELNLLESVNLYGVECLPDFWSRAVNLGFFRSYERLSTYSSEFLEDMKSINENREEINRYQELERQNYNVGLYK